MEARLNNISTIRALDEASSEGFYQRLRRYVRRRLGSDEDAADVVQDAYLRLVSTSDVRNPHAFLHTAALNLVRDHARSVAVRRAVHADAVDEVAAVVPSVEKAVADREQLAVLERALAELKPNQRAALVLYRFDGLSHAEIADKLGLSVSMIEKHIRRALAHCRARLAEANGDE